MSETSFYKVNSSVGTKLAQSSVSLVVCTSIGIILCLTGIGAIIGIPMLIIAWFTPLMVFMNKTYQGACPYCESTLTFAGKQNAITCKACQNRVIIRGNHFCTVDR